ncbi:hypothetical protein GOB94_08855 [Granulicella sp. 5B5]|uniref:hypothetical protein n=1 Tax=Granulicella sp. 5B5 TaxID=1617967 RepID=UPI0015F72DDC|nr:hypothetical protein [Granulicella sp. 5B5]QMV18779.1 hypothetical protein GOB94_08855 [Granulicella sp. 5B5]
MAMLTDVERARRDGVLFGIPFGDLGWAQSLLMGTAAGFVAFFMATFLAIVGFMIDMSVTGKTPNFALTYRLIGLPVGLIVWALALGFLGVQWAKRMARKRARA